MIKTVILYTIDKLYWGKYIYTLKYCLYEGEPYTVVTNYIFEEFANSAITVMCNIIGLLTK